MFFLYVSIKKEKILLILFSSATQKELGQATGIKNAQYLERQFLGKDK